MRDEMRQPRWFGLRTTFSAAKNGRNLVAFAAFGCQSKGTTGWDAFASRGWEMKLLKIAALTLIVVATSTACHAKTKKPKKVPAIFNQAQYVYVEAVDGQQFNPRLLPEDRQAIADVQDALSDWKRYTLTTRREDADLVFVVRKGRLVQEDVGVQGGNGPQTIPSAGGQNAPGRPRGTGAPGIGVGVGSEVSTPDDLFEVFAGDGQESKRELLWMRTMAGGLDGPKLALFRQFKEAVDRDYPMQQASKTSKP